ncbi:MAG TPA: hypothetical protein VK549_05205 [Acidimicrobiia bacterium]|nr:hypothetical protein [Acidimicrobiia bacterium]
MITAVVATVVLALAITVVIVIAKDRGPGPGEVAVAYELAWDRLDFESLYTLSGSELRDGLDRRGFIAAKRSAYEQQHDLGGLVERVGVDQMANSREAAVAITTVELHDQAVVHNRVEMTRRNGRWQVVAYRLEPSAEDAPRTDG